MSITQPDCVCL